MSAPKRIRSAFALGDARRLAVAFFVAGATLGCSAGDGSDDDGDGPGVADCGEGQTCTAQSLCSSSISGAPMVRRLSARELQATFGDVFPSIAGAWTSGMSADPVSHWGFDNESARLVVSKQTARELDVTATSLAAAVSDALPNILPCAATTPDRACASEFVARYGKLLFRRPLAAGESDRYLAFYDEAVSKTDFPTAIGWVTRALVMAPATLYRRELGVAAESVRQLDQYEIATALAYTFAGTGPNENLLGMADRGELSSPDTLASLAQQLIESPQGREHLHRFFEAFLEYSRVTTVTRDEASFTTLAPDMRRETRTFLEAVVFAGGGGVRELLTSNQTFPSVALAGYYGMPAPAGDYGAVTRPAGQGIGVLAQGSVLSTEAQPGWSSPTQRGLLVFERFLCREAPTVPPDVPPIPEVAVGEVTTRQRYEQLHASGGTCQTCHREFDPIGFGFESYDQVGRFRENENGLAIDPSGSIPRTDPAVAFATQEELASGLAELSDVHLCVSSQVKTYAFGTEDACLGEGRRQEFVDGAIGFVQYLSSLAAEPHFTSRRLQ